MALNPELYANEKASKYGINMKGSGQKINIVYNPDLVAAGKTRMATPNVIELGPSAFVSEEELANTKFPAQCPVCKKWCPFIYACS